MRLQSYFQLENEEREIDGLHGDLHVEGHVISQRDSRTDPKVPVVATAGRHHDGGQLAQRQGGYALFRTDDYTLLGEVLAQYSGCFTFATDPVIPAEDMVPAALRGLEWATS